MKNERKEGDPIINEGLSSVKERLKKAGKSMDDVDRIKVCEFGCLTLTGNDFKICLEPYNASSGGFRSDGPYEFWLSNRADLDWEYYKK